MNLHTVDTSAGAARPVLSLSKGRHPLPALALSLLIAASVHVHAQTSPLRNSPPPAAAASGTLVSSSTTNGSFLLKEVRFTPTRAVPPAELQALVKPFVGKAIDATELTVIAAAIRRAYEERGFGMAGVGFPPQDLTQGVLQIAIVEPQVERVVIESSPKPPVSMARTTAVLENSGVREGQPLDLTALDRAMFTLNDWPGVAAKVTLLPTGDEGKYKVSVQTERRRAWDASIDADNLGSSTSGRYRLGTLLRWNNPAGIGDNLDLRLLASNGNGTTVGRLGYEAPLGATPWRAGVGYSHVGYELGEQFAALGAVGTANVLDASLSYALVRSRDANLVGRLGLVNKKLTDETIDVPASNKRIRAAELTFSFESRSSWGGGGYNGGSAGIELGKLTYDSTPADTTTPGNFTKLSLQLTRLQALTRTLSLFVGGAGQWSSKNLDNAEKFTLGGDKGVRAYPAAEGSSDEGVLLNAELRYWINTQWSSFGFYDVGHGRLRKTPDAITGENTRTLHGFGLGVQYTNAEVMVLKASIAWRGKDPVTSESDSRKRLLLQVSHSF
ncbi:MAG: ShlB/FhaC/HecB family hemolysin secretion/activation protein [Rhizobacter sp.]